jgi:hypothetical protein
MVTCSNGHYYDQEKNPTCPYCANSSGIDVQTKRTVAVGQDDTERTAIYGGSSAGGISDDEKTVYNPGRNSSANATDAADGIAGETIQEEDDSPILLSGWLAIISDKGKGKSYTLTFGMNTIGRAESNHVSIQNGDTSISREKHALIIYDYENNIFFIKHGEGQYLSYLNGEVLLDTKQLKANDIIKVGSTELMFIPLCSDQFTWKD